MARIMDMNTLLLGFVAMLNLITCVVAYFTLRLTRQVEIATNSMKDALVKTTGEARYAEGKAEGRLEGR